MGKTIKKVKKITVKYTWVREYDLGKNETYDGWSREEVIQDALEDISQSGLEISEADLEIDEEK